MKVDLICRLVSYAALAPLIGLGLRGLMWFTGDTYIADFDLSDFFLSPAGILGTGIVLTVAIAVVAFDQVCLMAVASSTLKRHSPMVRNALWSGISNFIPAANLAARVVVRSMLMAAPFLVASGMVFLFFLTEYDISYYIEERPPEFFLASLLIGLLMAGMLFLLIPRWISWLLALPLILLEGAPVSKALATSKMRLHGRRNEILKLLLFWFMGITALYILVTEGVAVGGRWALGGLEGFDNWFLVVLLLWIQVWFVATYLVSFVQSALFSLLIIRIYGETESVAKINKTSGLGALPARSPGWISTRAILSLVVLLSAVLTAVGVSLLQSVHFGDSTGVVAHRGDSGSAPENTLAAIGKAIEAGAHWVEIDVQETLDGEVVVLHDSDLMRVAGLNSKIWELTVEDLKDIDVGSYFSEEFSDQRVPTLEAVLRLCKGKVGVIIELKFNEMSELLVERAIRIVEDLGVQDEVMFMSLTFDGVNAVYNLRPELRAGLATGVKIGDLTRVEADFLAVQQQIATQSFVNTAQKRGKEVYVWTVDEPKDMHKFFSRGIDLIITNETALATQILFERSEMGGTERLLLELAMFLGVDLGSAADR